jgi:DNA-binding NtrC family response regulator
MGYNLLIVEMDGLFRLNLSERLRRVGFKVFEATLQTEIHNTLQRKNIDVAVLGLNGLGREGLHFLRTIKEIKPDTEVIVINSSHQLNLSIEGMKLGAFDDFLIPFDLDALIERIQDACRKKRENKKSKRPLFKRYQDMMVAVSFAEAGESQMAQEFLNREKKPPSGRGKGNET